MINGMCKKNSVDIIPRMSGNEVAVELLKLVWSLASSSSCCLIASLCTSKHDSAIALNVSDGRCLQEPNFVIVHKLFSLTK